MVKVNEAREKWQALLRAWSVLPTLAECTFEELARAYSGPGRYYHTLDHVLDVLAMVENLAPQAKNLQAVQLAAWLHDAIYDSKASDNEEQSAQYAHRLCETLAIPDGGVVSSLILKTKTHEPGSDPDAQVLIDADLAILGASELAYRDYADKIRREYAWVPPTAYRQGRQRVLESFLARPKIFHFLGHLEESARHNLLAEMARLA